MPDSSQQSVLITGANGFVGSRLCRRFLDAGFRVIAGVRENCDRSLINDLDLEYRYGDVTHPESLPAMVKDVDYIVHNAGVVKVKKTETFYKVNHFGAQNIAEASLSDQNLKKFIYISSLAAAGPSQPGQPLTEDDPPHPITEYGRSKLAGEEAVLKFNNRLPVLALRPPGVYGPGDKEMFAFFQMLNRGLRPLLGNLERRIQLVHVDDLTLGVLKAVTAVTEPGRIYYIAESTGYSYRELVNFVAEAVGKKGFPLRLPGGMVRAVASVFETLMKTFGGTPMFTREKADELLADWEVDTGRAKNELGYESQYPFPEGAKQTVAWYRERNWL